jgi:hypothetical protein
MSFNKHSERIRKRDMSINIGIAEKDRKAIAKGLSKVLADS